MKLSKLVLLPSMLLNKMVKFGGALPLSPDLRILAFNSGIDSNASQVSSTSDAMWSSSLHVTESRRVSVSWRYSINGLYRDKKGPFLLTLIAQSLQCQIAEDVLDGGFVS